MKKAILFLRGGYVTRHLGFYKKLCRGRFTVAVDGGFRFFLKGGITPKLLIGDFDSVGRELARVSPRTEVLEFPPEKDWTDTELAVDYCLEQGCRTIGIVQPSLGEPDHFLANVMLLARPGIKADLRLLSPQYEMRCLTNGRWNLSGAAGALVSVLPLSDSIRLTSKGTEYDVVRERIERGSSRATRNRIVASRAAIEVRGRGLVYVRYPRSRD